MMRVEAQIIGGRVMERFQTRHGDRIEAILSGFDRLLFRGTLRSISYVQGLDIFLASHRVLYKDFGQYAAGVSEQLKAHAEGIAAKAGRPLRYVASSRQSKEDLARDLLRTDPIEEGLICVLSCVEPCQSFTVRRDRASTHLQLVSQERKCLHLYFYYLDRDFGLMHVRLQTWLPCAIQVCVNGREWLARQLTRAGVGFRQADHAFLQLADPARAQALADALVDWPWPTVLQRVARQVNPWAAAKATRLKPYYWTLRQGEYATDVLFRDAATLTTLYPRLLQHAMLHFGAEDVLRFLGRPQPGRFAGEAQTTLRRRPEGVRIKHWIDENSIKMYDKANRLLRIETTLNNPRRFMVRRRACRKGRRVMAWLPLRKGIADLRRRVEISRAANARYLDALSVVGDVTPSHHLLDPVSHRIIRNGRPYRPLQPISPQDTPLFRVVLEGKFLVQGIRNQDLRRALRPEAETDPIQRRSASAQITRHIRLLRAHGLLRKVSGTRYYRITAKGQTVMTTALRFRDTDIALLAA
jgi:hypothetical protein